MQVKTQLTVSSVPFSHIGRKTDMNINGSPIIPPHRSCLLHRCARRQITQAYSPILKRFTLPAELFKHFCLYGRHLKNIAPANNGLGTFHLHPIHNQLQDRHRPPQPQDQKSTVTVGSTRKKKKKKYRYFLIYAWYPLFSFHNKNYTLVKWMNNIPISCLGRWIEMSNYISNLTHAGSPSFTKHLTGCLCACTLLIHNRYTESNYSSVVGMNVG